MDDDASMEEFEEDSPPEGPGILAAFALSAVEDESPTFSDASFAKLFHPDVRMLGAATFSEGPPVTFASMTTFANWCCKVLGEGGGCDDGSMASDVASDDGGDDGSMASDVASDDGGGDDQSYASDCSDGGIPMRAET